MVMTPALVATEPSTSTLGDLPSDLLLDMYEAMLRARRLDERCWLLHRQGKIAFHISGMGHEAAQVGIVFAMRRGDDHLLPYYRDLAMVLACGMTPLDVMLGVFGKQGDPSSGGRQMPEHYALRAKNIYSVSSPGGDAGAAGRGRGAGRETEGRRSGRRDVPRRRLDQSRRFPRGPHVGGRPQTAAHRRRRE